MWEEKIEEFKLSEEQLKKGLFYCKICTAIFKPGNWVRGFFSKGTSGKFNPVMAVPDNKCPTCLTVIS